MYIRGMAIQILSSEVVDQISAGEVVERPAHLIKELIENSIDAGATELDVEFAQGGRWVRIQDNGSGMSHDDLELCLRRHATSKISKSLDIWDLHTFGFRGEALASISAVCRMTLTTKQADSKWALQMYSEFGKLSEVTEVGGEQGTNILVEELFSNTPARLKFLKSEGAEGTAIKNCLRALAMAHPNVNFRVKQRGKLLFLWPAQEDLKSRVEQVLEKDELYFGEADCEGVKAEVVISSPNDTVKNSRQIWLYVQNRAVQDRSLQTAVSEGYRSLLMHGQFPIAAIWVHCGPEEVDVNIHPTKSQVKFRDASSAFRAVHRAVRGVLERAPWLEKMLGEETLSLGVQDPSGQGQAQPFVVEEVTDSFQAPEFEQVQYSKRVDPLSSDSLMAEIQVASDNYKANDRLIEEKTPEVTLNSAPSEEEKAGGYYGGVDIEPVGDYKIEPESAYWSRLQVLGQANLTYIISQSEKAIIFVDQHAAHERVVFEELMAGWKAGQMEIQSFLLPVTIALEAEYIDSLMEQSDSLASLGLTVEQLGPDSVGVQSAPAIIKDSAIAKTVVRLATEIYEKGGSFALEKCISDLFATMACHSVVRAGQALSIQQMKSLLAQMDRFPLSSFCPHGRPVYVEYPFHKLERDFGRIV